MIRRPATRIELKIEEDIHEYEQMKEEMRKEKLKNTFNKGDKFVSELNFSGSSGNEGSFSKYFSHKLVKMLFSIINLLLCVKVISFDNKYTSILTLFNHRYSNGQTDLIRYIRG